MSFALSPSAWAAKLVIKPMGKHRRGHLLDVFQPDHVAAQQRGPGPGAEDQVLHRPRAGTPAHQRLEPIGRGAAVRPRLADQPGRVLIPDSRFPIPEFPIPDSRIPDSRIPNSQFPIPDSRFPNSRFPIPNSPIPQFPIPQFPIPNSQFPIPNSQFPIPNSQFPIPNSQFPNSPNPQFPIPQFPIPKSPIPVSPFPCPRCHAHATSRTYRADPIFTPLGNSRAEEACVGPGDQPVVAGDGQPVGVRRRSRDGALPAGAGAIDLDRVEVRPQLESQTRAVDLKRSSDAIEDAVSSDAMGVYPDKNVAESLQRLPGVSVTRDQGEGRFVVIRGLDANLNSVSVDGIAIGTPEDSSRAAPLDVIPSDSTERLRVVKSPTPDMPGDAIGGAILVESASAFDREGRNLRGKIEASHQQLSGKTSPKAAFNYSEVFADTFGVALGVNYQNRKFESDNTEVEYGDVRRRRRR